jgi:hypothetical protein
LVKTKDPAKAFLEIYFYDQSVTQIEIGNKIITEPQLIADVSAV